MTNFLNGWKVFFVSDWLNFSVTEVKLWSRSWSAPIFFIRIKKPSRLWSRVWKRKLTGKKFGCWLESSVEVTQTKFNRICQSKIVSAIFLSCVCFTFPWGLVGLSHWLVHILSRCSRWVQSLAPKLVGVVFENYRHRWHFFKFSQFFFLARGFQKYFENFVRKSSNHSRQEMDRCRRWPWDEYRGNELELAAAQLVERNEMKTND